MGKAGQSLAVAKANGFAPGVGRGHDQHGRQGRAFCKAAKKYGMQGRVRQHDTNLAGVGSHLVRQIYGIILSDCGMLRRAAAGAENNGFFRALQQGLVLRRQVAQGAGGCQIANHEGQRLVRACFAPSQLLQALGITRVASQLKAPQTFERQNPAVQQGLHGLFQSLLLIFCGRSGVSSAGSRRIHKPQARPARWAGHGLGMKAPVSRVGVFRAAPGAKRKTAHGRDGAVIRNGARDGVARPAVGAVGKGVPVARIGRIAHVGEAVGAYAHIRAYKHAVRCLP